MFVTTDAAYHVWHLAFDKILREAEQQSLLPVLDSMVVRLVEVARSQEAELAGTDLGEAATASLSSTKRRRPCWNSTSARLVLSPKKRSI